MRKFGFLSAVFVAALMLAPLAVTAQTTVSIEPTEIMSPGVGTQFDVEIVVSDVVGLYGFQLGLQFNPAAIQVVDGSVAEGDFLGSDGTKTSFTIFGDVFNAVGLVTDVTNTRLRTTTFVINPDTGLPEEQEIPESLQGLDGTGTLLVLTFEVVDDQVESPITFFDLALSDSQQPTPQIIPAEMVTSVVKAAVANQSPTAVIEGPTAANAGATVEFSGANSTDDGSIASYEWNFGDGSTGSGEMASHVFAEAGTFPVTLTVTDDMGETGTAVVEVTVTADLPPVITEHAPGSPMLVLEADYPTVNDHGHAYIAVWGAGALDVEAGMYLEYQIAMWSGNPTFQASVDIHFASNATLRDAKDADGNAVVDQNGIAVHPATDLSEVARDMWYHRKISLDALVGESIHHVTVATDSSAHAAGKFRAYVDNIQITTDEGQVLAVYIDEAVLPTNNAAVNTEAGPGGFAGINNAQLSAAISDVAVEAAGKLPVTWGELKKVR